MQVPQYRSQVIVRACTVGEVAATPSTCNLCPAATFSLSPANSSCDTPCPDNAECLGGALLIPEQGYWHSAASSTYMASCPNPSACSGARQDLATCQNASYAAPTISGQTQVYLLALPCGTLSCLACFALPCSSASLLLAPCPALLPCAALPCPVVPASPSPPAAPLPCPALPCLLVLFLQLPYTAFCSLSLALHQLEATALPLSTHSCHHCIREQGCEAGVGDAGKPCQLQPEHTYGQPGCHQLHAQAVC